MWTIPFRKVSRGDLTFLFEIIPFRKRSISCIAFLLDVVDNLHLGALPRALLRHATAWSLIASHCYISTNAHITKIFSYVGLQLVTGIVLVYDYIRVLHWPIQWIGILRRVLELLMLIVWLGANQSLPVLEACWGIGMGNEICISNIGITDSIAKPFGSYKEVLLLIANCEDVAALDQMVEMTLELRSLEL